MRRGRLIVLDGVDGSGKTTQARLLVARLRKEGRRAELASFPQYSANVFGRLIRGFLDGAHGDPATADPYLSATLYAADRLESKEALLSWLAEGKVVVCDRYVSANMIHQGGKIKNPRARARFLAWLETVEYRTFGLPRPDAVIYLSLSPRLAGKLLSKKDRVERSARYNRASFAAGKALARKERWITVPCEERGRVLPREAIHEKIYHAVANLITL